MKISRIFFVFIIFFILLVTRGGFAHAHGGVAQVAGNAIIYINQNPVSPFVGEKVYVNFVVHNKQTNTAIPNFPVSLTLVDTYYGDETRDSIMVGREETTDMNGSFYFSYIFPRENYYDINLRFKDPITGEEEETGLLLQVRSRPLHAEWFAIAMFLSGLAAAAIIKPLK